MLQKLLVAALIALTTPLLSQTKEERLALFLSKIERSKRELRGGAVAPSEKKERPLPVDSNSASFSDALFQTVINDNEGALESWDALRKAEKKWAESPKPHTPKSKEASGELKALCIGLQAGTVYGFQKTVLDNRNTKFYLSSNESYARQLDIGGHFFGSYVVGRSIGELNAIFFNRKTAASIGFGVSIALAMGTEIEDGFVKTKGGFSFKDAGANILGASWGWLNVRYPKIADYAEVKISANPRDIKEWLRNGYAADYRQHSYWLCLKGKSLSPKLRFLGVGAGVTMIKEGKHKDRQWMVGLDVNLLEWLPGPLKTLNGYRLPFLPKERISRW